MLPLKLSDLRMLRKAVAEAGLLREEHARVAAEVVAHRSNMQRLMAATEKAEAKLQYTEGMLRTLKPEETAIRESLAVLAEEKRSLIKQLATLREAYARDRDGDPVKKLNGELAASRALLSQMQEKNRHLATYVETLKQANAKGSKALNDVTDRYEELKADVERRGTEKEAKLNRRRRLFGHILTSGGMPDL